MKTSKKLLSFFLAVVMVVTTCSVGFTAFAQDNSKSIWSTNCDTDDAYEALNGIVNQYVPSLLLGIEAVGGPVYEKYARQDYNTTADKLTDKQKAAIEEKVTIPDIIEAVSPLLIDLLGGVNADEKNPEFSLTKSKFVYEIDKYEKDESNYDYLDTAEEGEMTFYTIYNICRNFKDSPLLAQSTREQLNEWYITLDDLANRYNKLKDSTAEVEKIAEKADSNYQKLSLAELEALTYDFGDKENNVKAFIAEKRADFESKFAFVITDDMTLTEQFARAIYYSYLGKNHIDAAIYDYAYGVSGTSLNTIFYDSKNKNYYDGPVSVLTVVEGVNGNRAISISYEGTGITLDNMYEKFGASVLEAFGLEDNEVNRSKTVAALDYVYLQIAATKVEGNYVFYDGLYDGLAVASGKFESLDDFYSNAATIDPLTWLTNDEILDLGNKMRKECVAGTTTTSKMDATKIPAFIDENLPERLQGTIVEEYFLALANDSSTVSAFGSSFMGARAYLYPNRTQYATAPIYTDFENYKSQIVKYSLNNALFDAVGEEFLASKSAYLVDIPTFINKVIELNYHFESPYKVVLDEDEKYNPADYSLVSTVGVDLANLALNRVVESYITTVEDLLGYFIVTEIDLEDVVNNILIRAYGDPLSKGTNATSVVFELLPVLLVLIDEFVVPAFLTDPEKSENPMTSQIASGAVEFILDLVGGEDGVGFTLDTYNFDLNVILPTLMHWLVEGKNSTAFQYTYYGDEKNDKEINPADVVVKDFDYYTIKDSNGYALTKAVNDDGITSFSYKGNTVTAEGKTEAQIAAALTQLLSDVETTFKYLDEEHVPVIIGVYAADIKLRDAKISDLKRLLSESMSGDTAAILSEAITEIAQLFMVAVDQFVATPDLVNAAKVDANNAILTQGLNNIFVAVPQLFDIMENLAAEKYSVSKNAWTYCYDGKIDTQKVTRTYESDDETISSTIIVSKNTTLENFKAFASGNDSNKSVKILDAFVDVFIGDWLNSILSLLNTALTTDNSISNNIPIISNLLEALGGFGKESILTDVFNGVFQLDRDSKYSFTLEKRENGFTGFSKDSAYFLITNIPRLIEVITNLVNGSGSDSGTGTEDTDNNDNNTAPTYKPKAATVPAADKSNYTDKELSNATDLINNLDKMLSSLLSDSSFNGFKLNSTDNILAGAVTFFSNYLGNDCFTDLGKLFNSYVFYITGSETHKPDSKGNVDAKKVYTNDSLTGLVVETFLLIEKIVENLLSDFNDTYELSNGSKAQYNLIVEAIEGLISPDAISVRLTGYNKVQKKLADYNCWHNAAAQTSRGDYKIKLDWGIKAGDKDAFYKGLAASLRLVTSILGVLLIDTNWYSTVLQPVLGAFCKPNGIKLDTAAQYKTKTNGYYDEVLLGIITPVSEWINLFLAKPVTTLIKSIQGLAGILDDKHGATIASILKGAITPIANEIKGAAKIFAIKNDKLLETSHSLYSLLNSVAGIVSAFANPNNIKLGQGKYTYPLSGENLIPIINSYIANTGITLKQINWYKLSTAKTPAAAFVYVLEYILEVLLENDNLTAIAKLIGNDTVTEILNALKGGKITPQDILAVLDRILEATDSPTLAYWTFAQYLQEASTGFSYPAGITKQMADNGVASLDDLIAGIFPLLSSFGVNIGGDDLQSIISNNLYKNSLITTIATALYGALDGLDPTVKDILKYFGIVTSTKDVAKLLTDKSYGATFTSAANTIKAQSSWKNVKNVNWGFTDGSAKAQQGFVNALAAVLRPFYDVLEIFLSEGSLEINEIVYDLIYSLDVPYTVQVIDISDNKDAPIQLKFSMRMKNGVLTMKFREYEGNRERSRSSDLKLDFTSLKDLKDLKIEGTNGYNSAIIPLLEALQCSNVVTYAQYKKDVAKAKDNLLLDVLNPLIGDASNSFINKLAANPVNELTKLLPNVAAYLDAHGLSQLVNNLIAPVTDLLYTVADKLNINLNSLVTELIGKSLGDYLGELLHLKKGTLKIDLYNLSAINLEDLVIPIVNALVFAGSDNAALKNFRLADIDWNALISLGTKTTYTSKATGADGRYLTGKMVGSVDQGKVLITVLRYVANFLVNNAAALKNVICSIDAIAKSDKADMIKSIISSVFNTIGTASADQIVAAVFYLLAGTPENAFWDYTDYKTGKYSFAYPETVDVDFLKSLPPMLDGLIGGLINLNDLVNNALFTDKIISSLATGLYGAVEGVKISDDLNLTQLLAQTDIDFSTSNVAKLLVDERYGQKFTSAASVISAAGSWKNVKADSLKWGVTDRDSFFHALVAVLRPLYGVLDVLLNDAYLGLFDIVRIPGSNGYTSSIVPLLEAFSTYNIKTQYQYRQDMSKEYDAILLDIINPIWDLVEDVLNAPLQTITAIIPNLALFIGNNGLCQILDNLLTPISALVDAIRPVVDLNDLLTTLFDSLNFDLNGLLAKIGVTNFSLDIYDLNKTLKPLLSADAIIPLVNNILGMIKIGDKTLGLKLNSVDWLQLASHGATIVSSSQAATYGSRIFVQGNSSETLIAILRYLINTVNTGDNFNKISDLIGGLLGDGVDDSISDVISQVMGMLQGDTDKVISDLVGLLQTVA